MLSLDSVVDEVRKSDFGPNSGFGPILVRKRSDFGSEIRFLKFSILIDSKLILFQVIVVSE